MMELLFNSSVSISKKRDPNYSFFSLFSLKNIALESMDDHPDTNSKADFARTSQTIRLLLNDLAKMQKLASINEQTMINSLIENNHYV